MTADGDYPLVENSADGLGVRVPTDIRPDEQDRVRPAIPKKRKGDGMSITPSDPKRMPNARRPKTLENGQSDRPLWRIDSAVLGLELRFRPDRVPAPTHGVIEPAHEMQLTEYRAALAATRTQWVLVLGGSD